MPHRRRNACTCRDTVATLTHWYTKERTESMVRLGMTTLS